MARKDEHDQDEYLTPFILVPYYDPPNFTEDQGVRPLPDNVEVKIWECPNIQVIRPDGSIGQPVVNEPNRIRVQVHNRSPLPALMTEVSIFAKLFGLSSAPDWELVGSYTLDFPSYGRQWIDLPQTWSPSQNGHACLLAKVGCPQDPSPLTIDLNDRHYAQRNVTVVELQSNGFILASGLEVWKYPKKVKYFVKDVKLEVPDVTDKLRLYISSFLESSPISHYKVEQAVKDCCKINYLKNSILTLGKAVEDLNTMQFSIELMRPKGIEPGTVAMYRFVPSGVKSWEVQGFTILVAYREYP